LKKNLTRIILTVVFIALAIIYLYPTYKDYKFNEELKLRAGNYKDSMDYVMQNLDEIRKAQEKRIKLGLDLKGGMYVILDVDVVKFLEDLADSRKTKDETLARILGEIKAIAESSEISVLDVLKEKLQAENLTLKKYYGETREDEAAVEKKLQRDIDEAIDRAIAVVRNRIDQYGVAEAQLQKRGNRIMMELPGVSNPDDVKKLLKTTAVLEFKLLQSPEIVFKVAEAINKIITGADTTSAKDTTTAGLLLDSNKKSQDSLSITSGGVKDTTTKKDTSKTKKDKQKKDTSKVTSDTSKKTDTSIAQDTTQLTDTGQMSDKNLSEEEFKAKYPFFYLVQFIKESGDGFVRESDKPKVDEILKRVEVQAVIPAGYQFAWSDKAETMQDGNNYYILYSLKKEAELTGKYITDARKDISQETQRPYVAMQMDAEGSADWARITGSNIGKRCAIVLDGIVYSAPVIRNKIPSGNSQIEGMRDMNEANLLVIVLKAGSLPAPLKIAEERSVGPSLGEDSIKAGITSSLAALILVALFMIVYYKFGGFVADFALIINVLFVLGIMASFGATLTLPGIAGLVLTLGMAVDTNVLIFERVREEERSGKPLKTCIEIGYKKAFSAIIDSHLTSVISGIALYMFGTGPIRGFAVTLLAGIIVNLFTAIVITHFIFDILLEKNKKLSFG